MHVLPVPEVGGLPRRFAFSPFSPFFNRSFRSVMGAPVEAVLALIFLWEEEEGSLLCWLPFHLCFVYLTIL